MRLVRLLRQGIQRGHAAGAGRCDGLAVHIELKGFTLTPLTNHLGS